MHFVSACSPAWSEKECGAILPHGVHPGFRPHSFSSQTVAMRDRHERANAASSPRSIRNDHRVTRRVRRFGRHAGGCRAFHRAASKCRAGAEPVQLRRAYGGAHIRADPLSRSLHPQRHEGLRRARARRRHRHRRPPRLCQGLRCAQKIQRRARRPAHRLSDRLAHQGVPRRHHGHHGRSRQAQLG